MKLIKILTLFILCAMVAVACQLTGVGVEKSASSTSIPETTSGYPPSTLSVYPTPTYPSSSYPSTDDSTYLLPTSASVLYPDAKDGDEVLWHQAITMILNKEVTKVIQTHDLKVYLTLKDGRTLVTQQPVIDEVIRVIDKCGENCEDIRVATE